MNIDTYIPLCNAMVLLMKPLIEIVIHDRESNTIYYINGTLSERKKGDLSLLSPEELEEDLDKIVYPKINFNGRLVKSISIPVDTKWLICINCDISLFDQIKTLSESLLISHDKEKPSSLFKNDWSEQLHRIVHNFIQKKSWNFETLTAVQKKALIQELFEAGAFSEKNAAEYVARFLKVGRATVFKYLKEWRT